MKGTIYIVVALLLLCACSHEERVLGDGGDVSLQKVVFSPSGFTVVAEKADSEEKRQKGLMGRKSLKDHEGMIFYFDQTATHAFWMFNTLIPLAVVFVDERNVVVDVQFMNPCLSPKSESCPVYVARQPSRIAIEINQDAARKYRISVGDRIRLEDG
jgi:uncharacterized protein